MGKAAAEIEEGGGTRMLKDLFAGAAGGIAQVLLGEFERLLLCLPGVLLELSPSLEFDITCARPRRMFVCLEDFYIPILLLFSAPLNYHCLMV